MHYCKVLLDAIFGRASFLNEIIWAYDYGARDHEGWPAKHDNILVYVKDPARYYFDPEAVERIPYMAPALVGPEKAARGKLPTDTWWHTIVPTHWQGAHRLPDPEAAGHPAAHRAHSSPPGGLVADFFAGSGTTGIAAQESNRHFVLVDQSDEAWQVMSRASRTSTASSSYAETSSRAEETYGSAAAVAGGSTAWPVQWTTWVSMSAQWFEPLVKATTFRRWR